MLQVFFISFSFITGMMRYDHNTRLLSLIRLNRGLAQSPFFDDYHKVDMYSEALYWVMDSEEISFEMVRGISQSSRVEPAAPVELAAKAERPEASSASRTRCSS